MTIADQFTSVVPKMRYSTTYADGVDGNIINKLGYDTIEYTLKIGFDWSNIQKIKKWLVGKGKLVLPDDSSKYYEAEILSQIEYKKNIKFGEANVKFVLQPIKRSVVSTKISISSGSVVQNDGDFRTMPILSVTGTGDVTVSVNGVQYCKLMFGGTSRTLVLDGQKQDCLCNDVLANRSMDGDFPELEVGTNTITFTGNVTSASVEVCAKWV